MKFGAVLPTSEIGNDPIVIRDFAQAAEELGYSHLSIYDHVLGAEHADREPALGGPYTDTDPFHEPFVLYGYLAGLTSRIELATGVVILPQRQTVLVAKQATELDLLSEGRFRLGVGTGWNWVEYDALGVSFEDRGERIESQVELLRQLWTQPLMSHKDSFHQFERAALVPRPSRSIPIWFGGMGTRPIRRAARLADGFTFGSTNRFMQKLARVLHEELDKQGRVPADFGMEVVVGFGEGPDTWKKDLETWHDLGASHFSMRAMSTGAKLIGEKDPGFTDPRQHIAALEAFMKAVS